MPRKREYLKCTKAFMRMGTGLQKAKKKAPAASVSVSASASEQEGGRVTEAKERQQIGPP